MVMGMEEDPEDHTAVASAVFISVAIYAVSAPPSYWHAMADTSRVS